MDKLELKNISYKIKDRLILDNINLRIEKGERIAICGPNGAGKSTLINLILNIPSTDFNPKTHILSGEIENNLFDLKTYQDVKVHLQNSKITYNLYLKVKELLTLCFNHNLPKELIRELALEDKLNNMVHTLSGGEFQRLNILLVLGTKPKTIFLDEMTTGLDYESKKQILSHLKRYITESKGTLVFVTHYLEEVTELADIVCFINRGRIVEYGKIDELFLKYKIQDRTMEKLYEEVIMK